jgi:diguanylate cyclase
VNAPPVRSNLVIERGRDEGLSFARRMWGPRAIGLGLGFFAVAAVFWQNGAHPAAWAGLFLHAFAWPHIAYLAARRSAEPRRLERRSLLLDSALGGMWIALMKFNLLPSVLLAVMLSMDKLSVGGTRFFARCATAMLLMLAATVLVFGLELRPESTMMNVVASLPLLVAYPVLIGVITYRLARRVRDRNRVLAELSRTDGLSGLLNRKSWEEFLCQEFRRGQRSGRAGALLLLDIDHFKRINDQFGHAAGDEAIRTLGTILRTSARAHDVAGRFGGEEFGVVLPETDLAGALLVAERLRARIAGATFSNRSLVGCTASIGVASSAGAADHAEWLRRADQALYLAKQAGRNRTELFGNAEA